MAVVIVQLIEEERKGKIASGEPWSDKLTECHNRLYLVTNYGRHLLYITPEEWARYPNAQQLQVVDCRSYKHLPVRYQDASASFIIQPNELIACNGKVWEVQNFPEPTKRHILEQELIKRGSRFRTLDSLDCRLFNSIFQKEIP